MAQHKSQLITQPIAQPITQKTSRKSLRVLLPSVLIAGALIFTGCNLNNSRNTQTENLASINKLVVFGDSLSDNGTLRAITSSQPTPAPEFFSNGPVWPNYFSEKLGINQLNLAVSGARSVGHDSAQLQAAATAGAFSSLGFTTGLGLRAQVDNFINNNTSVNQTNTLHTILIGGNDVLAYLNGLRAGTATAAGSTTVSNQIATTVTQSVTRLVANGARNIVVFALPEVADVPRMDISGFSTHKATIKSLVSTLNNKLVADLRTQRAASSTAYNIMVFNAYRATNHTRDSGDFTNVNDSWLVVDSNLQPTGANNGPVEEFLFWDTIHPTTAAHKMLADQLLKALRLQEHCLGNTNCRISSDLGME